METRCTKCGNPLTPEQLKAKVTSEEMTFYVEGNKTLLTVIPVNDSFYEVVRGKHKGSLVHRWDRVIPIV